MKKDDKMKSQTVVAVIGLLMAILLTGCGGSPKGVAEKFANAVVQGETTKAVDLTMQSALKLLEEDIKGVKGKIDKFGKDVNDNKLSAKVIIERITVPREGEGYSLVNGAKVTADRATVAVQYFKGKDENSKGMEIDLLKIDGKWKVGDFQPKRFYVEGREYLTSDPIKANKDKARQVNEAVRRLLE